MEGEQKWRLKTNGFMKLNFLFIVVCLKDIYILNLVLSFQCDEERNVFKERKKSSVIVVVVVEIVLGTFFKEGLHLIIFGKQLLTMQSLGDGGLFLWEETRSENAQKNVTGIYNRCKRKRNQKRTCGWILVTVVRKCIRIWSLVCGTVKCTYSFHRLWGLFLLWKMNAAEKEKFK